MSKNSKAPGKLDEKTVAAIALAIYMNRTELHDFESSKLTIERTSRNYSPWSSKIYSLRKNPRYT
jgi:hypothetical protein